MQKLKDVIDALINNKDSLKTLYPRNTQKQQQRYLNISYRFLERFPGLADVCFFSTPGRTEIGGNHTDHNGGRVLAGAINLDVISVAAPNNSNSIYIVSEGYGDIKIDLESVGKVPSERRTSTALVRGVCARMRQLGYNVQGFYAYINSDVKDGSGLSSSAAFEVQLATMINHLFNGGKIDLIEIAQIAQYAENHYFEKPCGLMDQTTCAVGGLVQIDFKDFENPTVRKVNYDFGQSGYAMVIVFAGEGHDGLNDEYEALENEMKAVAKSLGGKVLRDFSEDIVLQMIHELRQKLSDRAILRALHFYADDKRVVQQTQKLEEGNFADFLQLIIDSGYSSWMLCQNVYVNSDVTQQGLSIALAISKQLLEGKGAWRVHGGGFGGTIQAFVPEDMVEDYVKRMEDVFGKDSSDILTIRNLGSGLVNV
jgi:galactokinase